MAQTWVANNFAEQIIPSEMQETQMLKQLKASENFYAKHRPKQIQRTNCHITLPINCFLSYYITKAFLQAKFCCFHIEHFQFLWYGDYSEKSGREGKEDAGKPLPRL